MSETRYFAQGGRVYARTEVYEDAQEVGTALTADGRDLDRFERALNEARKQREQRAAEKHHIGTSTNRRGGSMIAGGGNFRDSSVHCSCGWEEHQNGQTHRESMQAAREHLKEMGVYTTQGEQTIYAHMSERDWLTVEEIAEKAQATPGRVRKALAKFKERGNIVADRMADGGRYRRTDKWFSWND